MTDTEKRAMYTMWAALPGQAHERHHTKGEMKEKKRIVCVCNAHLPTDEKLGQSPVHVAA